MSVVSRGFRGRRRPAAAGDRVPPGQYVTDDFPVLSAGPTPRVGVDRWTLTLAGPEGDLARWSWADFRDLPSTVQTVDIHCVTKWSKLDTTWEGVSIDTLLGSVPAPDGGWPGHALVHSYGGYTTNVPLADLTGGRAMVAHTYDGEPLAPEHGGPARLLVPHLYFWKSAKWVQRIELRHSDGPGFWETYGYHIYGDPWREQRYSGD